MEAYSEYQTKIMQLQIDSLKHVNVNHLHMHFPTWLTRFMLQFSIASCTFGDAVNSVRV